MNFRQLFDSTRLADYPNNRLSHPALAIPDGAPVYNLATAQEGVVLTRNGESIGISQIPGLPDWVVERFKYWNAAYNHALDFFWEQEPDAYALEAYGISIAADMADALNGRARVQYCGMPLHSEKALGDYFWGQFHYASDDDGVVRWHAKARHDTIEIPADAPLTPYMEQVRKEGERKDGAFDASYSCWWEYDYLDCILTIKKRGELHYAWDDFLPDWLDDFIGDILYQHRRFCDTEATDWYNHAWLFTLREDAMLTDLARVCDCPNGIAYKFGTHHISRPFPLGE